jgi:heterodisulfide reductase subunit C
MAEAKPLIKMAETDPNFKFEVSEIIQGKTVLQCFQCGMCTASCPVSELLDYKPNQIIRMVQLGLKDRVLSSGTVWICTECYACNERCPQGVEVGNVMFALKNLITKERSNYVPSGLLEVARAILKYGRTLDISDFENAKRKRMGLPAAPPSNVEAARRLLSETVIKNLIKEQGS